MGKYFSLLLLSLLLVLALSGVQGLEDLAPGFARMEGGTIGGEGGPTVYVSNLSELLSAVSDDEPRIVKVTAMINLTDWVRVGSNKSILGASKNAGISGAGFYVRRKKNVIIRGLIIRNPVAPFDGVSIDESTNVWVDHNEFHSDRDHGKDYYDGLLDMKHGADLVTVSWNKFHDHMKSCLFGHSDSNGAKDIGKLRVTVERNWFYQVSSRLPSIRFGTAHIFNNVYEDVEFSGINSRMGAQVLVENNVFLRAVKMLVTNLDSALPGGAIEKGNIWTEAEPAITVPGNFTFPPYYYLMDPVANVNDFVKAGAGNTISFP